MMSPLEIERLAEAVAERLVSLLAGRPDAEAMIDVHAVAELLACSVPTVERLTRNEALPSVKVGRLRRYRRADVLNLSSARSAVETAAADADDLNRTLSVRGGRHG
jgi:excisionase family DNA binding protein